MAKIIAIGNQKGGCGKTTVTCLLANALSSAPFNLRVFVADCDAQQSIILRRLADQQQVDALPPYPIAYKSLAELQRDIERLDSEHDLVFIDLPGRLDIHQAADRQEITRYLLYVDVLFVPFTPGNYATASSVDYLRSVQKIAATKSASPRPLTLCAFANMYEGGRTTDDRDLVDELDALRAALRIRVLDTRLQRYALFRSVDTFTSFYDPTSTDRAVANFTAFLDEFKKVIK